MNQSIQPPSTTTVGTRLRAAREREGWTRQEVAHRLHLPTSMIEAMEEDRFEVLGAPVYVRSHLGGYLRLMGLPQALLDQVLAQLGAAPPALRSATRTPPLQRFVDRYAMRAVYVILTLSVLLPALWVAMGSGRLDPLVRPGQPVTRSLDAVPPPTTEPASDAPLEAVSTGGFEAADPEPVAAVQTGADPARETVRASIAPFYAAPPDESDSRYGWILRFRGDSWLEVQDASGRRLEYGLVRAGSERRFPAEEVARVALGNAVAVDVLRDGDRIDLAPFRRANVARFEVSSDGSLRPVRD